MWSVLRSAVGRADVIRMSSHPSGSAQVRLRRRTIVVGVLAGLVAAAGAARPAEAAVAAERGSRSPIAVPMIFGIYPGGAAGTVGPAGQTKPEDAALRLMRLEQLRGGARPFVLHLYDAFTGRGDAEAVPAALAAAHRRAISRPRLPGRARPRAIAPRDPDGDVDGFVEFVRSRACASSAPSGRRGGSQVTNEVERHAARPSAADGVLPRGARRARAGRHRRQGEARRGGFDAPAASASTGPISSGPPRRAFWPRWAAPAARRSPTPSTGSASTPTRARGARALRRASLAAARALGDVEALRVAAPRPAPARGARRAPPARLRGRLPDRARARAERDAGTVLRAVARAVSDTRAAYGVTDFRWFDLRDADSALAELRESLRPPSRRLRARSPRSRTYRRHHRDALTSDAPRPRRRRRWARGRALDPPVGLLAQVEPDERADVRPRVGSRRTCRGSTPPCRRPASALRDLGQLDRLVRARAVERVERGAEGDGERTPAPGEQGRAAVEARQADDVDLGGAGVLLCADRCRPRATRSTSRSSRPPQRRSRARGATP